MTTPPLLKASGLTRTFGTNPTPAVDDFSLEVGAGEIVALVGPSGCGKSTTLRLIAGLEPSDGGTVAVAGRDVTALVPEKRDIGLVFQDYALFPSMTVEGNVRFGARDRSADSIARFLAMVGLDGLQQRYPDQLSGGQQQRVALARSLAAQPKILMLDEPFSNLDAALRSSTRVEIRRMLKATGIGVVCVTHDQEEALSFADRIAVMRDGRILQVGTPQAIYAEPVDTFVAGFMGRTNYVDGIASGWSCETALGRVGLSREARGPVRVLLRPEALRLSTGAGIASNAEVRHIEFRGAYSSLAVDFHGSTLQVGTQGLAALQAGDSVRVDLAVENTVAASFPRE